MRGGASLRLHRDQVVGATAGSSLNPARNTPIQISVAAQAVGEHWA